MPVETDASMHRAVATAIISACCTSSAAVVATFALLLVVANQHVTNISGTHPIATDAKVPVTQLDCLLRCDDGLAGVAVVDLSHTNVKMYQR
jgi:hypothetical protein